MSSKYSYTKLVEAVNETEIYNLYAVIVDATLPYKSHGDKILCSLKIMDPTLYLKEED